MKRRFLFPVILFATGLLLAGPGCIVIDDDGQEPLRPCLQGEGNIETVAIELPEFSGIELRGDVETFISQGPVQEVLLRAHENLIDELSFDVDGRELEIRTFRCIDARDRPTLFITLPELSKAVHSSTADIVCENTLLADKLEILLAGSGDFQLSAITDVLEANVTGSGQLTAEGETITLNIKVSGSGDFRGFGLPCQVASVLSAGSGDAELQVESLLEGSISGSGDIFFRGQPALDVRITGSGELIDAN